MSRLRKIFSRWDFFLKFRFRPRQVNIFDFRYFRASGIVSPRNGTINIEFHTPKKSQMLTEHLGILPDCSKKDSVIWSRLLRDVSEGGGVTLISAIFREKRALLRVLDGFFFSQKFRLDIPLKFLFLARRPPQRSATTSKSPCTVAMSSILPVLRTRYKFNTLYRWSSRVVADLCGGRRVRKRSFRRISCQNFWEKKNPSRTRTGARFELKLVPHPPPRWRLSVNGFI